jgi:hypothetical protein
MESLLLSKTFDTNVATGASLLPPLEAHLGECWQNFFSNLQENQ